MITNLLPLTQIRTRGNILHVAVHMKLQRAYRLIVTMLLESGTEWYEVTMGLLFLGYSVWTLTWSTTSLIPLKIMAAMAPPVVWGLLFAVIGVLKIGGVACRNDRMRHSGSWGATIIWLFLLAQYVMLEPGRLAVPTFGILFISNAWIVFRSSLRLDRTKNLSKPPCMPSPS